MSFLLKKAALAVAGLVLGVALLASAHAAEQPLPLISQTWVHRVDPVDAAEGARVVGTPALALRDGNTVRWFADDGHCGEYRGTPARFPDADNGTLVAAFGADLVLLFPNGVHTPDLGPVIAGNPRYAFRDPAVGHATFWFQNKVTRAIFAANPSKYIPFIGGYCPGAMAANRVTPGDPRNAYFIAEAPGGPTWGTFGSPKGPIAWDAKHMTPQERREHAERALANYEHKTGLAPKRAAVAEAVAWMPAVPAF